MEINPMTAPTSESGYVRVKNIDEWPVTIRWNPPGEGTAPSAAVVELCHCLAGEIVRVPIRYSGHLDAVFRNGKPAKIQVLP
jgi:hypothetical protein